MAEPKGVGGPPGPRVLGRLTQELILRSPQYMNCVKQYEIDLRASRITAIENLGATEVGGGAGGGATSAIGCGSSSVKRGGSTPPSRAGWGNNSGAAGAGAAGAVGSTAGAPSGVGGRATTGPTPPFFARPFFAFPPRVVFLPLGGGAAGGASTPHPAPTVEAERCWQPRPRTRPRLA